MNVVINRLGSFFGLIHTLTVQNKSKLFRVFLGVLIFAVILLNSGYTYTYLIEDTFYQTLVLIISVLTGTA